MVNELKEKFKKRFIISFFIYLIFAISFPVFGYLSYLSIKNPELQTIPDIIFLIGFLYPIITAIMLFYFIVKKYDSKHVIAKGFGLYVFLLIASYFIALSECLPYIRKGGGTYCGLISVPVLTGGFLLLGIVSMLFAKYKIRKLQYIPK